MFKCCERIRNNCCIDTMKTELFLVLLFLLSNLLAPPILLTSSAAEESQTFPFKPTDPVITNAIKYLKNQQQPSGAIAGLAVSAWAAMALAAASEDLDNWESLQTYLIKNTDTLNPDKATDWQRHTLALIALGENPQRCNGVNLLSKILTFYDGSQMGDPANIYDDLFGIISLRACGIKPTNTRIQTLQITIFAKQNSNGGWGDVDTTAMAIMALSACDVPSSSPAVQQALSYLKNQQSQNGGFTSWGSANVASTAWAVSAIVAAEQNPLDTTWQKNGQSPIDFLISLQQADGRFKWSHTSDMNPEWMTAYAIPALLGKPYPVKLWNSGSNPGEEQQEDPVDDNKPEEPENDDPSDTSPEENQQEKITFVCPRNQSFYLLNRRLPRNIKTLIIIGPIDIHLNTSSDIQRVEFLLNNDVYFCDNAPPYSCQLTQSALLRRINLTIKAYADTQHSYEKKREHCLENISSLLYDIRNSSNLQAIIDNISRLNCIEFPQCYSISQEFMYINPFPQLLLTIMERDIH